MCGDAPIYYLRECVVELHGRLSEAGTPEDYIDLLKNEFSNMSPFSNKLIHEAPIHLVEVVSDHLIDEIAVCSVEILQNSVGSSLQHHGGAATVVVRRPQQRRNGGACPWSSVGSQVGPVSLSCLRQDGFLSRVVGTVLRVVRVEDADELRRVANKAASGQPRGEDTQSGMVWPSALIDQQADRKWASRRWLRIEVQLTPSTPRKDSRCPR